MNQKSEQKARVVSYRHGFAWLLQSFALMGAQPGRLLLLVVLLQFIMGLTQVPLIGFFLIISVPALTAGLLQALHTTAEGGRPVVNGLFQPLTSGTHTARLLILGVLMFAVGVLTVALILPASEAMLDPELLSRIEQGDVEALSSIDQEALSSMVLAFLIGISISGTLSYMTIPLIWFHDRKLGPALADGLRALFTNWKPFLVLGLTMTALLIPVSLAGAALFVFAESAGSFSIVVMGLLMMLILIFQLILFGTQYCAFRDIFGIEAESTGTKPVDDGQLLA